jgi:hypothetical protein
MRAPSLFQAIFCSILVLAPAGASASVTGEYLTSSDSGALFLLSLDEANAAGLSPGQVVTVKNGATDLGSAEVLKSDPARQRVYLKKLPGFASRKRLARGDALEIAQTSATQTDTMRTTASAPRHSASVRDRSRTDRWKEFGKRDPKLLFEPVLGLQVSSMQLESGTGINKGPSLGFRTGVQYDIFFAAINYQFGSMSWSSSQYKSAVSNSTHTLGLNIGIRHDLVPFRAYVGYHPLQEMDLLLRDVGIAGRQKFHGGGAFQIGLGYIIPSKFGINLDYFGRTYTLSSFFADDGSKSLDNPITGPGISHELQFSAVIPFVNRF